MSQSYDDIIKTAYPIPSKYPKMSVTGRAAQFSPFAALTGYSDAIEESGRLTKRKAKLDPSVKEELNRKLYYLSTITQELPEITVTYFLRDPIKMGGTYFKKTGNLKRVDTYQHFILYTDGTLILMDDIFQIEADVLQDLEATALTQGGTAYE